MAINSYLVAIGSNLGDRRDAVKRALALIAERGIVIESVSELVDTAPIGAADQTFLNGAFTCSGNIDPDDFMRLLLDVENRMGRVRDVRWGNRVIDLDVLLIRDSEGVSLERHSPLLTVPHAHMLERDFMLRPAAAVAGHWVLPNSTQTLRALCVSRGWRPTWSNPQGEIKLWQAFKGDVFSATTSRLWWPVMIGMFFFRMWCAATVPYGNDEAYYWDWGRMPQASYFDHPPFVSWIALLSRLLVFTWTEGPLQGRFLIPFMHIAASLFFGALVVRLTRRVLTNIESQVVLIVTQLVPAFSLGGMMLMPDIGLILFSTAAVWFVLAVSRRERLTWWNGVVIGVVLGCAGLSKYHAALIGAGLVAWLFQRRLQSKSDERWFWFCLISSGLMTILPVILWNGAHDWVSFRYQGARGVSGGGFDGARAVRTLVGEALFLGPAVIGGLWLGWKTRASTWLRDGSVILWSALPMVAVLKFFSFTTQTLPHWSMPSMWLISILMVPVLASSQRLLWLSRIYGLVFCLAVPAFLSSGDSRRALLRWMGDRPGGLGELTLWDSASRDPDILSYVSDRTWLEKSMVVPKLTDRQCERGVVFAAPRWFTVAQTAATLPGHPIVETLDQDHLSYYHFRPRGSVAGCPVVILSEKSHWRDDGWNGLVDLTDSREFEAPGHRDRRIVIARGWFKPESIDAAK